MSNLGLPQSRLRSVIRASGPGLPGSASRSQALRWVKARRGTQEGPHLDIRGRGPARECPGRRGRPTILEAR